MNHTTTRIQDANSAEELKTIGTDFIEDFRNLIIEYPEIAYDLENNEKVVKASIRLMVATQAAQSKFEEDDDFIYQYDLFDW